MKNNTISGGQEPVWKSFNTTAVIPGGYPSSINFASQFVAAKCKLMVNYKPDIKNLIVIKSCTGEHNLFCCLNIIN